MKGISPLISVVLIIGITFGLYIVINTWAGGFFKGVQESSESKISEKLDCSLASITAEGAVYNRTSGKLYVIAKNDGQISFSSIMISVLINNTIYNFADDAITPSHNLPTGVKNVYIVNTTLGCFITMIKLITECDDVQDSVSKSDIVFYGC